MEYVHLLEVTNISMYYLFKETAFGQHNACVVCTILGRNIYFDHKSGLRFTFDVDIFLRLVFAAVENKIANAVIQVEP
jgi:hypothetical protein